MAIVPWTSRNYVSLDAFVFVASNSGLNLFVGNSEHTTAGGVNVDISRYEAVGMNHFNFRNQLWAQSEASRLNNLVMLLTYGPLLVARLVRMALVKVYPLSRLELLFVLIYLVNGLFSALFFTRNRFRVPFDLVLIGLVAVSVATLLKST